MSRIEIESTAISGGWESLVAVGQRHETRHRVRVAQADLTRLDPGATDPDRLVRASFEFLLEREPSDSILSTFDLTVIGRYFPEYEREIESRLRRQRPG